MLSKSYFSFCTYTNNKSVYFLGNYVKTNKQKNMLFSEVKTLIFPSEEKYGCLIDNNVLLDWAPSDKKTPFKRPKTSKTFFDHTIVFTSCSYRFGCPPENKSNGLVDPGSQNQWQYFLAQKGLETSHVI